MLVRTIIKIICFCLVFIFTSSVNQANAQTVDYDQLTLQEQADFSRWLGWVWGDGKPHITSTQSGIRYGGPGFSGRYNATVQRLLNANLGIVLGDGGTNEIKIVEPWDFWNDAIPGQNPNETQLLRDAVRNPNFLAGIIDTEGGGCASTNGYFIDDHYYGPGHPDPTKNYGILNFGINRMVQLFHLIGGTYGFENASLQVGTNGTKYKYGIEAERQMAFDELEDGFNATLAINQSAATIDDGTTKRVRIYIDNTDWDTIRSYGFWEEPDRYPDCNQPVVPIPNNMPLTNLTMAPANVCSIASNFQANNIAETSASISWLGDSTNNSYEMQYRVLGTDEWTNFNTAISFALLNGLNACTEYEYRVKSNCVLSVSEYSTVQTFTTIGCQEACPAISGLFTSSILSNSALLIWDIVPFSSYTLYYKEINESTWYSYDTAIPVVILFGLNTCSTYEWYIVNGCDNGALSADSNITSFSTVCKNTIDESDALIGENFDIAVFPVPFQVHLSVEFNLSENSSGAEVQLLDVQGKQIASNTVRNSGKQFVQFNTADLAKGIYLVRIDDGQSKVIRKVTKE